MRSGIAVAVIRAMAVKPKPEKPEPAAEKPLSDRLPDRLVEANRKATELLGSKPRGDEHYPGEVVLEKLNLKRDLPRR